MPHSAHVAILMRLDRNRSGTGNMPRAKHKLSQAIPPTDDRASFHRATFNRSSSRCKLSLSAFSSVYMNLIAAVSAAVYCS